MSTQVRITVFFALIVLTSLAYFERISKDSLIEKSLREHYEAAKRIPDEIRYRVYRNWKGKGHVLVGRIQQPEGTEISRRATIHTDGSFATAVYPGRTLEFYAHGYEPLIIEPKTQLASKVYDAGENEFQASTPERLRQLEGRISLESPSSTPLAIRLELRIPNDATVSRDHGHWQHRTEPVAEAAELLDNNHFTFNGLSPIPYELLIKAEGYIERTEVLDPNSRGSIDLGTIVLQRATTLRFDYISQIDIEAPQSWPAPERVEILCNGKNLFHFTDHRDKHRNRMKLKLIPSSNGIETSFTWAPSEYYDLGEGSLQTILAGVSIGELPAPSKRRLNLKDGHIYFFRNKKKAVSCLFQVTEL